MPQVWRPYYDEAKLVSCFADKKTDIDNDITIIYVFPSVRLSINGLTYSPSFSTKRQPSHSTFTDVKHFTKFKRGHPPGRH